MKMQDRMKMRSVSFSDDPQPPGNVANRGNQRGGVAGPGGVAGGIYTRKQNSAENLPLYDTSLDPLYSTQNSRLNSLPRMMPHHRRKILENNRPASSLAGIMQCCHIWRKNFNVYFKSKYFFATRRILIKLA